MASKKQEDPPVTMGQNIRTFLAVHWRGVLCVAVPILLSPILSPPAPWKWVAFTLIVMAIFWVAECIPLAVTSFLPVIIFPLTGVMDTAAVCKCYINDTIVMFIGSMFLAYSVEQSGLHKRLAFFAIRVIGYSHVKLLLAMSVVTTFVSMWITNTAATTMMIPINFALLRVFENEGLLTIYETSSDGEQEAALITVCYFCSATFSATNGGIGTLVGTGTNLVFKGLFTETYPRAEEYLSFPKFSMFSVPLVVVIEICTYIYLCITYFGLFRKNSAAAKSAVITKEAMDAAKLTIEEETKKIGSISFWEIMVCVLFSAAMISFFSRSPQIFYGWGDVVADHFGLEDKKFLKDSVVAMLISFVMLMSPSTLDIFKNCTAKYTEELPKSRVPSVLQWTPMNATIPFSFSFLLGGGFALSNAAKASGLNDKIGEFLQGLKVVPNTLVLLIVIIVVVFVTNFASNVAVANVFCPIAMQLAKEIGQNPLSYCLTAGLAASFCYMLPVGTPGNLIVQSVAKVPTRKMMVAGFGPTISTIFFIWVFMLVYAPIVWPDIAKMPSWTQPVEP